MYFQITTTPALIGIRTHPAVMEIHSPPPRVEMETQAPKLTIETQPVKVYIDQRECFKELGYKNVLDLTRERAEAGYNQVMEYIADTAREGDRLAAIELKGNPIAHIAENKLHRLPISKPMTLPIPKPKFDVSWDLNIHYQPGKVVFNPITNPVTYKVTPHYVEIFMRQYHDINIEHTGHSIDRRV